MTRLRLLANGAQTPVRRTARKLRRRSRWRAALLGGILGLSLVAAGLAVLLMSPRGNEPGRAEGSGPARLVAIDLHTPAGPLVAVVGASGALPPAAFVVPTTMVLTIPGQGDGSVSDAAAMPGRSFATAISNALGAWVDHFAVLDGPALAHIVDLMGGIRVELTLPVEVGGDTIGPGTVNVSGEQVNGLLQASGLGELDRWRSVLAGLLAGSFRAEPADFVEADDVVAVTTLLRAARGATVTQVPVRRVDAGLLVLDEDGVRDVLASAFDLPASVPVPVIVLNGSGVPGVGEVVAEKLVPMGFRVVDSENAASFGHRVTTIVAASPAERATAERIRTLLGVGTVEVSGLPSGLGDVTIVVGKDFSIG